MSVQSNLFHERKQEAKESVDDYTQVLLRSFLLEPIRRLSRAEEMGRPVFPIDHYVAGLCPEIKSKVVGIEGFFLVKLRFEEAKLRGLAGVRSPARGSLSIS